MRKEDGLRWDFLWVALGSAIGGAGRYWISGWVASTRWGEVFPAGTLVVNLVGSFLIGVVAALGEPGGRLWLSPVTREFLMLGLMGGFTTFYSFSLQTLSLLQAGEFLLAGLNILLSVAACLLAVWIGYQLGAVVSR